MCIDVYGWRLDLRGLIKMTSILLTDGNIAVLNDIPYKCLVFVDWQFCFFLELMDDERNSIILILQQYLRGMSNICLFGIPLIIINKIRKSWLYPWKPIS